MKRLVLLLILISFSFPAFAFDKETAFVETVFYKKSDITGKEIQIFYVINQNDQDAAASVVKVVLDIGKALEKRGFERIRVGHPAVDSHPVLITLIQKVDKDGDQFIYAATTEVLEQVIPNGDWLVKHFYPPYDFSQIVEEILERASWKRT